MFFFTYMDEFCDPAFLEAQTVKNTSAMQKTGVWSLGWEDPLEKGRSPGGGKWIPTPVFWPGEFHGQRSVAGYSSWGIKESDKTEQLSLTHSFKFRFNKNISNLRDKHVSLAQEVPVIIHFLHSSTHTYTCGLLYIRALQRFLLLIIMNSDKMVALILQFCALNVTMRETTGLMWPKGNKVLEKPALFNTMKIVFTYFH